MLKPLNNNVLVEVITEYGDIIRNDENERMQRGRIIAGNVTDYHLTASSAIALSVQFQEEIRERFNNAIEMGSVVRWQEYADSGQTFEEDGKKYALIPWWRLISIEEAE